MPGQLTFERHIDSCEECGAAIPWQSLTNHTNAPHRRPKRGVAGRFRLCYRCAEKQLRKLRLVGA